MDKIVIKELIVETIIGAYAWEKQVKQKVIINLQLATDAKQVSQRDNLEDALDYADICERLSAFIQENPVQLLETLAEKSAQFLLDTFSINWLRLEICKPGAIAMAKNVSVVVERDVTCKPSLDKV